MLDLFFGEPQNFFHPVYYIGRIGSIVDKARKSVKSKVVLFAFGILALVTEILLWLVLVLLIKRLAYPMRVILSVVLFKFSFSIRGLYEHVHRCCTDDLEVLRRNVSLIVSRDVSKLDKWHLYSAALESLSENVSDSITGPWFYFVLFDLPGAWLYRVVNTYDALFGYRNERYEWFGKFAARMDDVLNLIPSRISCLIISLFNPKRALSYVRKYGPIKINSTYPMSAFAGVLGVKFEKVGYYAFEGKEPGKEDILRGLKLYKRVVLIMFLFLTGLLWGFRL